VYYVGQLMAILAVNLPVPLPSDFHTVLPTTHTDLIHGHVSIHPFIHLSVFTLLSKLRSNDLYTSQIFVSYGYLPLRGKGETLQVLPTWRFVVSVIVRGIVGHVVPGQVSASLSVTPETECIRPRERRSYCWTQCTAGSAEININLLAPGIWHLNFSILYMENANNTGTKKVALWNKRHFE
jgi:hypothetical protein